MASLNGIASTRLAAGPREAGSTRATLRSWAAELAPFPNRWRRAARVAFVTAIGAGVMAAFQIVNPLGLTMLVSLAAPEFAFSLATGVTFLAAAAAIQILMLALVGATVDSPVVHVCAFIAIAAVSTYLIYGVARLGRLWLWIQIPAVTAFYLVLFDRQSLGWDNAQMFAGLAIAVALLWLFNHVIWPEPAEAVLTASLQNTLERLRYRLNLLIAIFLGDVAHDQDRVVASKLAYHLMLLRPATRNAKSMRSPAEMLGAVMVAERIRNEIDRLCAVACTQPGIEYDDDKKRELREAATAIVRALEEYAAGIGWPVAAERGKRTDSLEIFRARVEHLNRMDRATEKHRALGEVAQHLIAIGELITVDEAELPAESLGKPANHISKRVFPLNKFLVRFCARHTVAMTIAFAAGLADNSAAIHASLWLLMIGGPPSHGATAQKFTVRAIGASAALIFAALATIVLAPNFVTIPPYMVAIFIGVLPIVYIGEGGGQLSYLSIGATAFVIAFSGPGPRPELLGSIWTIWGISLGMIIRAVVSVVSIERPNRTLAEEVERPLNALVELVPSGRQPADEVVAAEFEMIAGIEEMLSVAGDAQLEGASAGIDARNLVDALDTMRRLAFALGNLSRDEIDGMAIRNDRLDSAGDTFDRAIRSRLASWLASIRSQLAPGQLTSAPLRTMISSAPAIDFTSLLQPLKASASDPEVSMREHVSELIQILERQLAIVSLS